MKYLTHSRGLRRKETAVVCWRPRRPGESENCEPCEIYGAKRTETLGKCDWNVFYEPLTASMSSNVNPFSPLNFLALLMVIKSAFIVSGAAGFSLQPLPGEEEMNEGATSSLSKLKIVIQASSREILCVRGGKTRSFLIKNKTSLHPTSFTKLNFSESLVDWWHFDYLNFHPHGATFISPHLKIIQLSDKRLLSLSSTSFTAFHVHFTKNNN